MDTTRIRDWIKQSGSVSIDVALLIAENETNQQQLNQARKLLHDCYTIIGSPQPLPETAWIELVRKLREFLDE